MSPDDATMTVTSRRLGPGDEAILERLALDDADFDLDGRAAPGVPLDPAAAERFLASPVVLLWAAFDDGRVVGFLLCHHLPLRSDDGHELLLYEIGVRSGWRRRGVGRTLLGAMEAWMEAQGVAEVWVLADNEDAVAFYRAGGFGEGRPQPVYMTLRRGAADGGGARRHTP